MRRLPQKLEGNKLRGDQRLRNDLIDVLAAMNIGWSPDLVESVGEKCIKVLVSSLWYIDACHKQFYERSIHLPSVIDKLEGYNNWRAKKEKKPQLTFDGLSVHLDHMTQLLNQPWIFAASFKPLYDMISALAEAFNKYCMYLK